MAEYIYRVINGSTRRIEVEDIYAGDPASESSRRRQIPKQNFDKSTYSTPESFTNPNAICKECGQKVFYYEHANGAKVLFDQLGPPWPLHPCYEANHNNQHLAERMIASPIMEPGWEPLFIEKMVEVEHSKMIRVQAKNSTTSIRFELKLEQLKRFHIPIAKIELLLMMSRKLSGDLAEIQIHDGKQHWKVRGQAVGCKDTDVAAIGVPFLKIKNMESKPRIETQLPQVQDISWENVDNNHIGHYGSNEHSVIYYVKHAGTICYFAIDKQSYSKINRAANLSYQLGLSATGDISTLSINNNLTHSVVTAPKVSNILDLKVDRYVSQVVEIVLSIPNYNVLRCKFRGDIVDLCFQKKNGTATNLINMLIGTQKANRKTNHLFELKSAGNGLFDVYCNNIKVITSIEQSVRKPILEANVNHLAKEIREKAPGKENAFAYALLEAIKKK